MSNGYTIEFDGSDVGLVVRQEGERIYRFHAAERRVHALDGSVFVSPTAAERAVARHLRRAASRQSA